MFKVKSINRFGINSNSINSNSNSSINSIKEINKEFNIKNYDFALFKHAPNRSTILKKNLEFLDYIKSLNAFDKEGLQYTGLVNLAFSINNKLVHPVIVEERDNKLHYVVKTSKDHEFYYWNEGKAVLQIGNVLSYEKGGFLSNVNHCVSLDRSKGESLTNNSIFRSIKGNNNLMKRFNFKNEASVKKQLEMYASIVGQNEPISINYLKWNDFYLFDHAYDVVDLNFVNGKITEEAWVQFVILYCKELDKLEILSLNNNNNDE